MMMDTKYTDKSFVTKDKTSHGQIAKDKMSLEKLQRTKYPEIRISYFGFSCILRCDGLIYIFFLFFTKTT